MKLIIAVFASLFVANSMATTHHEAADMLEMRAEALEVRAEQLQDLAAVYRRALTSIDGEIELVRRGATLNCHCDRTVPASICGRAKEKVQKMYANDAKLHKFKNGEIFVPRTITGKQTQVRGVAVALYNESRRPISAPTVNVAL